MDGYSRRRVVRTAALTAVISAAGLSVAPERRMRREDGESADVGSGQPDTGFSYRDVIADHQRIRDAYQAVEWRPPLRRADKIAPWFDYVIAYEGAAVRELYEDGVAPGEAVNTLLEEQVEPFSSGVTAYALMEQDELPVRLVDVASRQRQSAAGHTGGDAADWLEPYATVLEDAANDPDTPLPGEITVDTDRIDGSDIYAAVRASDPETDSTLGLLQAAEKQYRDRWDMLPMYFFDETADLDDGGSFTTYMSPYVAIPSTARDPAVTDADRIQSAQHEYAHFTGHRHTGWEGTIVGNPRAELIGKQLSTGEFHARYEAADTLATRFVRGSIPRRQAIEECKQHFRAYLRNTLEVAPELDIPLQVYDISYREQAEGTGERPDGPDFSPDIVSLQLPPAAGGPARMEFLLGDGIIDSRTVPSTGVEDAGTATPVPFKPFRP
ncbi:MAG: hypothetical protein SVW77_00135 [Candidatus Nanohaloarchaea archaeon]|nr:hypothetical protein [Candidatus Nanohaloarchaea archaeon]